MTQVFLSHSTVDVEIALQLAADLRAAGIPVWKAPESILAGEEWVDAIQRGLNTSTHLMLIQSPASVKSKWVTFEFNIALMLEREGKMRIMPIAYQACELPLFWKPFQQVDGINDNYHAALFEIMTRLRADQPAHPPEPTSAGMTLNVSAGSSLAYTGKPVEPPQVETPQPRRKVAISDILPPPLAWIDIPAGWVTLDGDAGTFKVEPFRMAKYPTTYAQFQMFVKAKDGFHNPKWWEGLAADDEHKSAPGEQKWKIAKHPREHVSWYDAVAYTRWLSEKLGEQVRLPTEWEWQWAAQGEDGRTYPWGEEEANKNLGNFSRNVETTTPVDAYPNGASPFGLLNMSGNVWEWCLNEYNSPENIAITGTNTRVLRGGSWYNHASFARVAYRINHDPHNRSNDYGFRLVVVPPFSLNP